VIDSTTEADLPINLNNGHTLTKLADQIRTLIDIDLIWRQFVSEKDCLRRIAEMAATAGIEHNVMMVRLDRRTPQKSAQKFHGSGVSKKHRLQRKAAADGDRTAIPQIQINPHLCWELGENTLFRTSIQQPKLVIPRLTC
jgi:hypothetical protein